MQHTATGDPLPWRTDVAHLDGLPVGAVVVDARLRVTYCNDAAAVLFGRPGEDLLGQELPPLLFAEPEQGAINEVLALVLEAQPWSGDLPVRMADGSTTPAAVACSPVWSGDRMVGALVLVEDVSRGATDRSKARRLADRLTRIARVTAELMMADHLDAVTKVVIEHTADATGATVASLSLLVDDATLALIGLRGGAEGLASRWATYPVTANTPAGESVRTGEKIVLSGRAAIQERYPGLESVAEGERSMISLPLKVTGRPIGSLGLSFPGRRTFDANELEFLGILADTCAQAIDRVNALAEAVDQERKLQFLADASAELAGDLDYQTTLKNVARLAVPNFADWCSIQLVEDGELRTLAVAHADPAKVALALDLQRRYPADPSAPHGAYNVLRTGVSELIPEIPDDLLVRVTVDEEHLRLARALELRSALSVPLKARGRVLGVISWVTGDAGRRFKPSDLAFAEDLARRAAVAIDNSELHTETREAAAQLQRAVLPERLARIPGWELAVYYTPAGRTEVGGDFFDVLPLVDGRVAMFVGDVMGRGVRAAAAMVQMRSAILAYLAIDPEPEALCTKLDLMFAHFDIGQLVTLVYGVADPDRDELRLVNAGHPPPVIVAADGTARQLPVANGVPLGVDAETRTAITVPFRGGETFLAFTDGLIERRTEDIDIGQDRLFTAASGLAVGNLPTALNLLVETVRDSTRDDDIAVLAARRSPPG